MTKIKIKESPSKWQLEKKYNPQTLFGMSWEDRYKKWKNYDTLPIFKNDKLNVDLWEKYWRRTPRTFKASDIWSVGIIAFILMTGQPPWPNGDQEQKDDVIRNFEVFETMEWILTREYEIPDRHGLYDYRLTEGRIPVTFRVKCKY